jgi:hypothetical protein
VEEAGVGDGGGQIGRLSTFVVRGQQVHVNSKPGNS